MHRASLTLNDGSAPEKVQSQVAIKVTMHRGKVVRNVARWSVALALPG
jgi:hypothetical protein